MNDTDALRVNYENLLKQSNHRVDISTVYLVCGYIRILRILNQIIPTSIIQLCVTFYRSQLRIAFIEDEHSTDTSIKISEMDTNNAYQCNVKSLSGLNYESKRGLSHLSGLCYVEHFKIPQHVVKNHDELNEKQLYDVIFRAESSGTECHGYIINSTQSHKNKDIDTFHWPLPSFSTRVDHPCLQYAPKYGLIAVGNKAQNSLHILKFDDNNKYNKDWKWETLSMETQRNMLSADMISDDELICCGGSESTVYGRYVDKYNFETKKWTKLGEMHHKRICAGIRAEKIQNKCVYVSGGQWATQKFEFYEMEKDQWYMLPDTNAAHDWNPIIWLDDVNTLNIASSYGHKFEQMDLRENIWRVYVSDESSKTFPDIFGSPIKGHSTSNRLLIA